jgi:hypothetical protein
MIDCPIPDADQKLVFDFFWKFSAFECALKEGGFLSKQRDAKPDWDEFANRIDSQFAKVSDAGFQNAVTRIKKLAPQHQFNDDNKPRWEAVLRKPTDSDTAYTLRLLRTARNNLFHGGKYQDGSIIPEIARDREILLAASTVLDGCYELHPEIKRLIDHATD